MLEVRLDQSAHEFLIPFICRLIGAKTYLELGVYEGRCLFNVAAVEDMHAVGVDINPLPNPPPANVKFVQDTTENYLSTLTDEVFDVVFIDADHSWEAVLSDFGEVFSHVSEHGLILLHDTFPANKKMTDPGYCGTAFKAPKIIKQLEVEEQLEMATLPYHPGLTIIRKRSKQVAW